MSGREVSRAEAFAREISKIAAGDTERERPYQSALSC